MLVKNFEDLEIWKEARRLTLRNLSIYPKDSKFSKDFGLAGPNATRSSFNHVEHRRRI